MHNSAAQKFSKRVEAWLIERGLSVFRPQTGLGFPEAGHSLSKNSDLILTIGGDGTIISIARRLAGTNTPIAGINLGRVGFLPELHSGNWQEALAGAIERGLSTDRRMVLDFEVRRKGAVVFSGVAVNDVVISRGGLARLLAMDIYVKGKKLVYLRADGLIISTPTGSTAYSSSAGGPILHPALNVYSVTAICPFLAPHLPLVLGAEAELTALILETSATTFATIDGQELFKLNPEDTLLVKGLPDGILFASFGLADYFEKLQTAGFIKDSPGGPKSDALE